MNVNKHLKEALAWTLEGVNDAEADQNRPGDGRVEREGTRDCTKDRTEDTESGRRKTMNKYKQKHKKFMR